MSSTDPVVTVLIPAYRPGAYLAETLRSVDAQTYPHVRAIVSFDHAPGSVLPEPPRDAPRAS